MVEEQIGLGKEPVREPAPWTKIFSGFRVAADPKKLLLAAAGIFLMGFGWYFLASFFFAFNSKAPQWSDSTYQAKDAEAFKRFKRDRANWNLMHKLAGSVTPQTDKREKTDKIAGVPYDVADFTYDLDQYNKVKAEEDKINEEVNRKNRWLIVGVDANRKDDTIFFELDGRRVYFNTGSVDAKGVKESLEKNVRAEDLVGAATPGEDKVKVKIYTLTKVAKDKDGKDKDADWETFQAYVNAPASLSVIENQLAEGTRPNPEATRIALKVLRLRAENIYKPAGYLATLPWSEYRGPNPFLVVIGETGTAADKKGILPGGRTEALVEWFMSQAPVLLEPLVKFLSPVIYFLDPAGYFWTKVYLLLVILVTIIIWSFFGGAISRMAAVQVARPTERVGISEAIRFTISRYRSFIAAQLLPFGFLLFLTIFLVIFGFFEILIPGVGDILIAGLGLPLVLILGLVMAVVLVGLTGWPLMYATISTEGSDSFDAVSRSYSYVYQAPWHYLWYGFVALVYGAALVFFVGLMGSLLVYLAKWGMSIPSAFLWQQREPSYLFRWAPTSYGWRDLLLHGSQYVTTQPVLLNNGHVVTGYVFQDSYLNSLWFYNDIGSAMVTFWLCLLFLMIIGFGYSYFWSASSIIYLLMRRRVDDTEMDEVHLEEEEIESPAAPAAPAQTVPAPATPGRTTVPLNVVEGPTAHAAPPARTADGEASHAPPASAAPVAHAEDMSASPKKTQLAPGGGLEGEEPRGGGGHSEGT